MVFKADIQQRVRAFSLLGEEIIFMVRMLRELSKQCHIREMLETYQTHLLLCRKYIL
jgi:hypothetical protein